MVNFSRISFGNTGLLEELRRRKIRRGVFTRNCRAATRIALGVFRSEFDLIVTREDAPPKPDPQGLRQFLADWELQGSELLFVGDSRFDIECGMLAGGEFSAPIFGLTMPA